MNTAFPDPIGNIHRKRRAFVTSNFIKEEYATYIDLYIMIGLWVYIFIHPLGWMGNPGSKLNRINYKERELESPLGSDLARLVRIWRALIDHRLKPLELTQTHWITLHNICQLPPEQSQIQLAKAIGIEQPSLVRTLDQLEEKGLITRHICPNDRRAKRIKLTESADPIIKEVNDVIDSTRDEILNGISQEEIQLLSNMIAKLEKNILELYNRS